MHQVPLSNNILLITIPQLINCIIRKYFFYVNTILATIIALYIILNIRLVIFLSFEQNRYHFMPNSLPLLPLNDKKFTNIIVFII